MADLEFIDGRRAYLVHGRQDPLLELLRYCRNIEVLNRLATDEKGRGPATAAILKAVPTYKSEYDILQIKREGLLRFEWQRKEQVPAGLGMPTFMESHQCEWVVTEIGDAVLKATHDLDGDAVVLLDGERGSVEIRPA